MPIGQNGLFILESYCYCNDNGCPMNYGNQLRPVLRADPVIRWTAVGK